MDISLANLSLKIDKREAKKLIYFVIDKGFLLKKDFSLATLKSGDLIVKYCGIDYLLK